MDPPAAPSTLVATATSETSVSLTWTDNATNESEYRIERSTDGVTFAQIANPVPNTTSFANTGLTRDQIYYYRVRAYNAAGNSIYTNVANATPIGIHLEVPIELMDTGVLATASTTKWLRTRTSLDTAAYDGTITYRFEAICSNTSGGALSVELFDASDVSKATLSIPANAGVIGRYVTTWTPTAGANNYRFATPAVASGALTCYTARILVQQINPTKTKIYIPMSSDLYNRADSDNTEFSVGTDTFTSSTYGQGVAGHYSAWTKDTSRFGDLIATNPWTFEAVVASETGSGRVSLQNKSTATRVIEINTPVNTPSLVSISFPDNQAGFTNLDTFEVQIRKSAATAGTPFHLYKSNLWVSLTNLNKADVYYRSAKYISTTSSVVMPHSRVHLDLTRFANIIAPVIAHQATGLEPVVGTSDVLLRSTATSDSATTGTDLSSSIINFDNTSLQTIKNTITPVSEDRFIPSVTVSSGTFQLNNSFIIISIAK